MAEAKHGTMGRYTSRKWNCRCVKCKAASNKYQKKRRENPEVREKDRLGNAARRKEVKDYLYHLKETTPCADCNKLFPFYVMDFDHLDGTTKAINVSQAPTLSVALLEIVKCEIVCSNCHRIRTYNRRKLKKTIDI